MEYFLLNMYVLWMPTTTGGFYRNTDAKRHNKMNHYYFGYSVEFELAEISHRSTFDLKSKQTVCNHLFHGINMDLWSNSSMCIRFFTRPNDKVYSFVVSINRADVRMSNTGYMHTATTFDFTLQQPYEIYL